MAARIEGERAIQAGFTIDNGVMGVRPRAETDKEEKSKAAHYRPPNNLPAWLQPRRGDSGGRQDQDLVTRKYD